MDVFLVNLAPGFLSPNALLAERTRPNTAGSPCKIMGGEGN